MAKLLEGAEPCRTAQVTSLVEAQALTAMCSTPKKQERLQRFPRDDRERDMGSHPAPILLATLP